MIRSIDDVVVLGRPAKCVLFETQFGDILQRNQVCMDAESFQVGSLWEPARISRNLREALRMEIEQKISTIEGAVDPNVFTPPTQHWNKLFQCQTSRRPIAISTPQPAPGNQGDQTVDVVVTGWIWNTGKTYGLTIQDSPRPDLNAEALAIVSQWRFQPMICNDKASTRDADFLVHFQGR